MDLRGRTDVGTLRYESDALVVVGGLPGVGKSTLLQRCVHRCPVADAQNVRERWAARLPGLPYAVYRPLVRLAHYARLRTLLRQNGPLVVHDAGAQPWVRTWLMRTARRQERPVHLLLIEADLRQALDGQTARGRTVSRYAMARHLRAARSTTRRHTSAAGVLPGFTSVALADRAAAARLESVTFGP